MLGGNFIRLSSSAEREDGKYGLLILRVAQYTIFRVKGPGSDGLMLMYLINPPGTN